MIWSYDIIYHCNGGYIGLRRKRRTEQQDNETEKMNRRKKYDNAVR